MDGAGVPSWQEQASRAEVRRVQSIRAQSSVRALQRAGERGGLVHVQSRAETCSLNSESSLSQLVSRVPCAAHPLVPCSQDQTASLRLLKPAALFCSCRLCNRGGCTQASLPLSASRAEQFPFCHISTRIMARDLTRTSRTAPSQRLACLSRAAVSVLLTCLLSLQAPGGHDSDAGESGQQELLRVHVSRLRGWCSHE